MIADIEASGLDWTCVEREYPLVGDSSADCKAGEEDVFVAVFEDDIARGDRLVEVRESTHWHTDIPAVALGTTWQAYCPSENPCRDLVKKLGGSVVTAPDYSVNG